MKRHFFNFCLLFVLFCTCLSSAFGQKFVKAGSLLGTGSFLFSTGGSKDESGGTVTSEHSETTIGFSPAGTYFIADDIGVGLAIGISSFSEKDKDSDGEFSSSEVTIGPMVRYYFAEGPFAQGYFGVGSYSTKGTSGGFDFESKYSVSEWQVGLGYSVRVSDTILLDPMVGYGSNVLNNKDSDASSTRNGLFISLGFTLILLGAQ